ncbi:MAG: nucleotidyl transferase AbiEii/AbiGii toxin family protein, partial [Burkholderiales bacterium]
MAISLDLSQRIELRLFAAAVHEVSRAASDAPFFLAGALARDVLLQYAHGIDTGRQTADVDLALAMENWRRYEALRADLIRSGQFAAVPAAIHKLRFRGSLEVDFLPFGPIERADRTIAWPPDGAFVMTTFGFREMHTATISVALPDGAQVQVASLPALALLKLVAWANRRLTEPGKDAHDLKLILRHYLDAGNADRLHTEGAELLQSADFDYETAGAWLLGKDMAHLLDAEGHE